MLYFLGVPADAENRVRRRLVEFLVFNSAFGRWRSLKSSGTSETQPQSAVRRRVVEFLVFNSIYLKICVPSDAKKVVASA